MGPWPDGAACDGLRVTWPASRAGLALHLHVCRTDGKTMAITLPLVRLHIVPGRLQRLENRSISPHPVLGARLTEVETRGNERAFSLCEKVKVYSASPVSAREALLCLGNYFFTCQTSPAVVCLCLLLIPQQSPLVVRRFLWNIQYNNNTLLVVKEFQRNNDHRTTAQRNQQRINGVSGQR